MLLFVTLVVSLVVWVVLWALGAKAIDAALLSVAILLVAAAAHIMLPMLPGNRGGDQPPRPGA
jgi:hypothetical protein